MKKRNIFTLVVFSALTLSSCGLELNEVYYGNAYNSPIFEENYYRVWDSRIDSNNPNNKIISETIIPLDETQDSVFTSFYKGYERKQTDGDPFEEIKKPMARLDVNLNLLRADSNVNNYKYHKNIFGFSQDVLDELNNKKFYGDDYKMNNIDPDFKQGYLSKLYDGWMFCGGRYQLARVQIDESGFGTVFNKQSGSLVNSYFAINFKASNDYTDSENPVSAHFSDLLMKVSFYCRNDDKFDKVTYTYPLYNVPCNFSDIKCYDTYTFFGFKINSNIIKNLQGYSIEYDLIKDEYTEEKALDHSLMLYEVVLPNSTWR
jgi:hypothetical protein